MEQAPNRKSISYGAMSVAVVLLIAAGVGYAYVRDRNQKRMAVNFNVSYPRPPKGWEVRQHGPQTLFLYEEPARGLSLRGAVNQMVSEVNPTPDLDRDNLAQLMIDNTHANMPGWTADMKDVVQSQGTTFRLVRRTENGLVIVTAFAVEGNTTVLVSLSARNKKTGEVDKDLDEFRQFISQLKLTKADSSKW